MWLRQSTTQRNKVEELTTTDQLKDDVVDEFSTSLRINLVATISFYHAHNILML